MGYPILTPEEILADAIKRFRDQAHAYRQLSATELAPSGQMTRAASIYLNIAERSLQHGIALASELRRYLLRNAEGLQSEAESSPPAK